MMTYLLYLLYLYMIGKRRERLRLACIYLADAGPNRKICLVKTALVIFHRNLRSRLFGTVPNLKGVDGRRRWTQATLMCLLVFVSTLMSVTAFGIRFRKLRVILSIARGAYFVQCNPLTYHDLNHLLTHLIL